MDSPLKKRIFEKLREENFDIDSVKENIEFNTIIEIFINFLTKVYIKDKPEINLYEYHIKLFIEDPIQEIMVLLSLSQSEYYQVMLKIYLEPYYKKRTLSRNDTWVEDTCLFLFDESINLCGRNIFPDVKTIPFLLKKSEDYIQYFDLCVERLNLAIIAMRKPLTEAKGSFKFLHEVSLNEDLGLCLLRHTEVKKAVYAHLRDTLYFIEEPN